MARYNILVHVIESAFACVFQAPEAREAHPPRRPRSRPSHGRDYHDDDRRPGVHHHHHQEVHVTVNISTSPRRYEDRAGLKPTRTIPTSRVTPGDNPARVAPVGLPGAADARIRALLAPAHPDGPTSRPWPPRDA